MRNAKLKNSTSSIQPLPQPDVDPDMLMVECVRCGAPVLWEKGQAKKVLESVGIDPLELDPYCLLVTDGCPQCSDNEEYAVQVYRVETEEGMRFAGKIVGTA